MTVYQMEAKENFDATRIADIEGLTTYLNYVIATDQNYQGIQWDPVRRNLMYMYMENTPSSPTTNTTGFTLWNGDVSIAPGAALDPSRQKNSSVAVKNIDTETVTIYNNYNVNNLVPAGIGGGDGTWRRYTSDFSANQPPYLLRNGPGMTDPYTGNFWVNSESCQLYLFRLEDDYSQIISPIKPQFRFDTLVKMVGLTGGATVDSWVYAREIEDVATVDGLIGTASLYLTPREITAEETSADELLIYATFAYPRTDYAQMFTACNREVFDHSGHMYLASCKSYLGKDFKLYRFDQPTSAPYGGPTVGGGFTDITPWAANTGPNADGTDYTLYRDPWADGWPASANIIPMYLPATDELAIISKFFPSEKTASSKDPALMKWSCTYVSDPSGTPAFDHHSSFVTGYMSSDWSPSSLASAGYAVYDAFEVNNYLNQSDYVYDIDYSKRWFFFLCNKVTNGVADNKARIVLVEYQFVNGAAPVVLQVVDEQGWDDAYPAYADHVNDAYTASSGDFTRSAAVATAMQTGFNYDEYTALWDAGVYDPVTNAFWWSGGGSDSSYLRPRFSLFDSTFYNRAMVAATNAPYDGAAVDISTLENGATQPFLKLSFTQPDDATGTDERRKLTVWGFNQDGHKHFVFRLGTHETLVFDRITGQWAEWRTPALNVWRAHLGLNYQGIGSTTLSAGTSWNVIGGDDRTGILWTVDPGFDLDTDRDGVDIPFTRQVQGMYPMRLREGQQCGGIYVLADLGDPANLSNGVTLYISDNDGRTFTSHGTVSVIPDDTTQEVSWIGLGLITSPGRLFMLEDDGAFARISSMDMR